jgi:MFS-type transporter involved in bile tolerance (Atg22 family)
MLLLSILIVVINMFSTLIVAVLTDYIKSRLVVSVELNRHKILTLVANLGK